ncbi:MAG: DUF1926 domain-containing protein [Candidatus Lokiarchaeota archaeon]|nr:DUF1926 domain-containing protein [Candidatus Lokiarchaeota archaeon]
MEIKVIMMVRKLNFSIVFHFHQPVDNFDHVIENAYEKSYLPLLEVIKAHPKIKVGLHYTGSLLEWLVEKHPEYIDMIKELNDNDQIEILSGGFYEPILAVIPDEDKLGQINLLKNFISENFGTKSYGFWLAERIWEPHLPRILELADLKYILIDDFHLKANGLSQEETFYPYITEEQGSKVTVVPINEQLRYLTPWKMAEKSLEYLSQFPSEKGDRIITLIDDAEKMGVWPAGDRTTYDICFGKGYDGTPWLEKFFNLLEEADWLNVITIKEYLDKFKPKGLVYMPTASYDKMSYWVLPTNARKKVENLIKKARKDEIPYSKDILEFVKGGFWRGFLKKYHESNAMHKKMLYVRDKLKLVENLHGFTSSGKQIKAIKNAWRELYKGQGNDPYWHGQFGGIYFGFMRQSIYHHLIHAEKILENIMQSYKQPITPSIRTNDIDFDGRNEILMETKNLNVYISSFHGGSIFEIDEKGKQQNILNVLQRRKEAYHEEKLKLPYDRWRKYAFMDHFTIEKINFENLINDSYEECGDFVDSQYKYDIEQDAQILKANLWKIGFIKIDNQEHELKIKKEYELSEDKPEINIRNSFKNLNNEEIKIKFITEIPFYLSGDTAKIHIKTEELDFPLDENKKFSASKIDILAEDLNLGIKIKFDEENTIFKYDLYTFISTDGSKDSIYQGTSLTIVKDLRLIPNEKINFNIQLKIYSVEN